MRREYRLWFHDHMWQSDGVCAICPDGLNKLFVIPPLQRTIVLCADSQPVRGAVKLDSPVGFITSDHLRVDGRWEYISPWLREFVESFRGHKCWAWIELPKKRRRKRNANRRKKARR